MLYRKAYLDLVVDDGTVCVAYDSRLELFGSVLRFAGVELYEPDGTRRVFRARGAPLWRETPGTRELQLAIDDGVFRIRQRAVHGAFLPRGAGPCAGLRWQVRTARAHAAAELEIASGRRAFSGLGYEDEVRIETPTRALGLESVQWGRAHLGGDTWVYNVVALRGGARWSRLCRFDAAERRELHEVRLARSPGGVAVHAPDAEIPLELRGVRVLHEGEAIDERRFPSWLERGLTRTLSGPIFERRSLSRACHAKTAGWAIDEVVHLGKERC